MGLGFPFKSVHLLDPYVCFGILILDIGLRKNIYSEMFIVVVMSLENASLDFSISPVTKKDPGLVGPDTHLEDHFLRKRVQNYENKIRHESGYLFKIRDINKLRVP